MTLRNKTNLERQKIYNKNSFEKKFTSYFLEDFSSKWDNLFLYKNGFINNILGDQSIINKLKNPGDNLENSGSSFVDEFLFITKNIKNFSGNIFVIFNTVDESEEFSYTFTTLAGTTTERKFAENISNTNIEKLGTFVQKKDLIIKIDPSVKVNLKLENIEKLFLNKDFNVIDISKNLTNIKNYNNLESLVIETSNEDQINKLNEINNNTSLSRINNKTFSKVLSSLKQSFQNTYSVQKKEIFNPDDEDSQRIIVEQVSNKPFFSDTIGFSIRSLSVGDLLSFPKDQDLHGKINDFKNISSLKNLSKNERNNYTRNIFGIDYISPFTFENDKTYFNRKFMTSINLIVENNHKSGENNPNINITNPNLQESYDISILPINEIKERLNNNIVNVIGSLNISNDNNLDERTKEIIRINEYFKGDNSFKRDIDYIRNIYIDGEFLYITLSYIKINQISPDLIRNSIYKKAFFDDPDIFLETVNGTSNVLELDKISFERPIYDFSIDEIKDKVFSNETYEIDKDKSIVGFLCRKSYKISLEKIAKSAEIVNTNRLKSLAGFYEKRHLYFTNKQLFSLELRKDSKGNNGDTCYMPVSRPNYTLGFLLKDNESLNRESSDVIRKLKSKQEKPDDLKIKKENNRRRKIQVDDSLKGGLESVLKVLDKTEYEDESLKLIEIGNITRNPPGYIPPPVSLEKINDEDFKTRMNTTGSVEKNKPVLEERVKKAISRAEREWDQCIKEANPIINNYIIHKPGLNWKAWSRDSEVNGQKLKQNFTSYHKNGDFEWCGAFVAYCYTDLDPYVRYKNLASTARLNFWNIGSNARRIKPEDIQPGDIVVIYRNNPRDLKHGDHITLCVDASGIKDGKGYFSTIEGNAVGKLGNGKRGQGVVKNNRSLDRVAYAYRLLKQDFEKQKDPKAEKYYNKINKE